MYKVLKAETLAAKIHLMVVACTTCGKPLSARTIYHCEDLTKREKGSRLPSAITIARPVQLPSYSRRSEHLPLRCPH